MHNGTVIIENKRKYYLKTDGRIPVCHERQTERPISACSLKGGAKAWEVRGSCVPSTCQRAIEIYKRTSQGCKCITKRCSLDTLLHEFSRKTSTTIIQPNIFETLNSLSYSASRAHSLSPIHSYEIISQVSALILQLGHFFQFMCFSLEPHKPHPHFS